MIGYGAMLCEGSSVARRSFPSARCPGDYYAINVSGGTEISAFDRPSPEFRDRRRNSGGRRRAVSLAVGFAQIF
jgi:hypothetical protein